MIGGDPLLAIAATILGVGRRGDHFRSRRLGYARTGRGSASQPVSPQADSDGCDVVVR